MASHEYRFLTHWRVEGTPEEISEILEDPLRLPEWWPSVYLKVEQRGQEYHLHTRGWLPYTLRWAFRVVRADPPSGFALRAWGDLEGQGEWKLTALDPSHTSVVYDWRVAANKPILRYLSWLLKPVFAANHGWAMRQGLVSLNLELKRRRGQPAAAPPGPLSWGYFFK